MKNYVQPGEVITLTAPYAVASGDGFLVGSIFAVATTSGAINDIVEGMTCGVIQLKKTSAQAWTVGQRVYWDNTAKEVTTTVGSNTLIGAAVSVAVNPSATGVLRLNGSF